MISVLMHTAYAATETEEPPEQPTIGIQCDIVASLHYKGYYPTDHSHH